MIRVRETKMGYMDGPWKGVSSVECFAAAFREEQRAPTFWYFPARHKSSCSPCVIRFAMSFGNNSGATLHRLTRNNTTASSAIYSLIITDINAFFSLYPPRFTSSIINLFTELPLYWIWLILTSLFPWQRDKLYLWVEHCLWIKLL